MDQKYQVLNEFFPKEISQEILKSLCLINMSDYMESKGIDFNKLSYGLQKYGCVISGSFPLLCLHEINDYYDIDIYGCSSDSIPQIKSREYGAIYDIHKFEEHLAQNCINTQNFYKYADNGGYEVLNNNIRYVRNYNDHIGNTGNIGTSYENIIQFVSVETDNIRKFIYDTFDMSFCTIIYDGVDLIICDFDMVIKKEGKLSRDYLNISSFMQSNNLSIKVEYNNNYFHDACNIFHQFGSKLGLKCLCHDQVGRLRNYVRECEIIKALNKTLKTRGRITKYNNRGFVLINN